MMIVVSGAPSITAVDGVIAALREARVPCAKGGLLEERLKDPRAAWRRHPATDEAPGYHDDDTLFVVLAESPHRFADWRKTIDAEKLWMAVVIQNALLTNAALLASEIYLYGKSGAGMIVLDANTKTPSVVAALKSGRRSDLESVMLRASWDIDLRMGSELLDVAKAKIG